MPTIGVTARVNIVKPSDASVDDDVAVTLMASDQFGNLASAENGLVTLITNGTAAPASVSGAGTGALLQMVKGKGVITISNKFSGLVKLFLHDSLSRATVDFTSTETMMFYPGASVAICLSCYSSVRYFEYDL